MFTAEALPRGAIRPGSLMRALVADGGTAELRQTRVAAPTCHEVLIENHAVGLCRTDLHVISGELPVTAAVIPGHEFAGTIAAAGEAVTDLRAGDRVVVDPRIACGLCPECSGDRVAGCRSPLFLGVDLDGACAEFVVAPAAAVTRIPDHLSFLAAAFAEPLAAALAVLKADIRPAARGLMFGDNRIAQLTLRVLKSHGFTRVQMCAADEAASLPDDRFDFIVETQATTESLATMVRLVRPRGRIILKSRQHRPVALVLRDLLPKEPIFEAVNYGSFERAVELLASGAICVEDLIGECYPLREFQQAIAAARSDETRKTFLLPREE